jgi:hypothetical protein
VSGRLIVPWDLPPSWRGSRRGRERERGQELRDDAAHTTHAPECIVTTPRPPCRWAPIRFEGCTLALIASRPSDRPRWDLHECSLLLPLLPSACFSSALARSRRIGGRARSHACTRGHPRALFERSSSVCAQEVKELMAALSWSKVVCIERSVPVGVNGTATKDFPHDPAPRSSQQAIISVGWRATKQLSSYFL